MRELAPDDESRTTPSDVQQQLDFQPYGAIAATQAPTATAEQIAPVYWDLHTHRDEAERVFTG
ncbi:hypothetical protein [Nonomuraea sp. SYSU D8015]|uniref:hypothetical protein n=1 Tax=Nonomuraea sp. SYSU D8015 TaxID=2593644 RepID=UPI001CB71D1F|nr:hypothetical protein [Nonomuraea sp. SYSU D8015]